MPWTMDDYPPSLKNFTKVKRKKAIDIANAMIDEGYSENKAIPIATEQAKKWYENASEKERKEFEEHGDITKETTHLKSRPELLDKPELVLPHKDGWSVQSKDAKKPTKVFENKEDAVSYGKKIAKNKKSELIVYLKDKSIQHKISYE